MTAPLKFLIGNQRHNSAPVLKQRKGCKGQDYTFRHGHLATLP